MRLHRLAIIYYRPAKDILRIVWHIGKEATPNCSSISDGLQGEELRKPTNLTGSWNKEKVEVTICLMVDGFP